MESEVIKFISEFVGVPEKKITADTLVNDDLGVAGDDGIELMEAFANRFNVGLSTWEQDYFGPEGMSPFVIILLPYALLKWLFGNNSSGLVHLPVAQFIKSAEAGQWVNM